MYLEEKIKEWIVLWLTWNFVKSCTKFSLFFLLHHQGSLSSSPLSLSTECVCECIRCVKREGLWCFYRKKIWCELSKMPLLQFEYLQLYQCQKLFHDLSNLFQFVPLFKDFSIIQSNLPQFVPLVKNLSINQNFFINHALMFAKVYQI